MDFPSNRVAAGKRSGVSAARRAKMSSLTIDRVQLKRD